MQSVIRNRQVRRQIRLHVSYAVVIQIQPDAGQRIRPKRNDVGGDLQLIAFVDGVGLLSERDPGAGDQPHSLERGVPDRPRDLRE